jgi:hypothetical protein
VTSIAIYLLGKDLMMLQEELKEGYDRGAEGGLDIRGNNFGASRLFFFSYRKIQSVYKYRMSNLICKFFKLSVTELFSIDIDTLEFSFPIYPT